MFKYTDKYSNLPKDVCVLRLVILLAVRGYLTREDHRRWEGSETGVTKSISEPCGPLWMSRSNW